MIKAKKNLPDKKGYFGDFGGRYIPETLFACLEELEKNYNKIKNDAKFHKVFTYYLNQFAGRPTPLYYAKNLSKKLKVKVYLKREDLLHTGAHKINNSLGQALLALKMGKKRIVAETGAGQHGVATATVAALFGLSCDIYMGALDIKRQQANVKRMQLLGARVKPVYSGSQTLKDACSEAIRDWVSFPKTTYYLLGSVTGPHPYPMIVRDFQSIIGREARKQILQQEKKLPDFLLACVGGGSNSIGLFHPFFQDKSVRFIGIEAAGTGLSKHHSASLTKGKIGILHGAKSLVLQDKHGQILEAHSIAPGLDYPAVGPEHAYYKSIGRAEYVTVNDRQAIEAFKSLCRLEGIIPALESSHALAYLKKIAKQNPGSLIIVCLSGRGDKDLGIVEQWTE